MAPILTKTHSQTPSQIGKEKQRSTHSMSKVTSNPEAPSSPVMALPSQSPSFLNPSGLRDPYQPHVQGLSPVRSQRMGLLVTSNSTEAQTDMRINHSGLVYFQLSV